MLFCVKSFDTETAAAAIRPAIGPETAVVSLQNGVDNEDKLARALGPGTCVGGVAQVFATIEAPGVIVHRLGRPLAFGELDRRSSPRLERLRAAFTSAGVAAEVLDRHHPRPLGEVPADLRAGRDDRAHALRRSA